MGSSWKLRTSSSIPADHVSLRQAPVSPTSRACPPDGKGTLRERSQRHRCRTELTVQDRVIAALVENIEQQLPGGYQMHVDMRLDTAIKTVDKMFTARKLPLREQLIAELTLWQCHTKDGIRLMERSYQLLHNVIRMIDATRDLDQ